MKKSTVIFLHVFFWTFLLSTSVLSTLAMRILPIQAIGNYNLIHTFTSPLYFYFGYFLTFTLLRYKKTVLYTCLSLVTIAVLTIIFLQWAFSSYFLLIFLKVFRLFLLGCLFHFFIDWIKKNKKQLEMSKQQLQSELDLLRSQINPHFLFNSLHNIDTLITTNPEKASDSLIKLSDMLRYVIYEANTDEIELNKEIEYIRKYTNLQSLRTSNKELVTFHTEIENEKIRIAPMLLIPFVENAFKHLTDRDEKNGIVISLKTHHHTLFFKIINTFDENKKMTPDATSGIGIQNVKRRLELLYPHRHRLEMIKGNRQYIVKLDIDTHAD